MISQQLTSTRHGNFYEITQPRVPNDKHLCAAAAHVSSSSPFPFTRFESSSAAAAVLLISFNECLRTEKRKEGRRERERREIEHGRIRADENVISHLTNTRGDTTLAGLFD